MQIIKSDLVRINDVLDVLYDMHIIRTKEEKNREDYTSLPTDPTNELIQKLEGLRVWVNKELYTCSPNIERASW